MEGLEPPRLSAPDPKSGAAAITPHPQKRDANVTKLSDESWLYSEKNGEMLTH